MLSNNAQRQSAKAWRMALQEGIERARRNLQEAAEVKEKQASVPTSTIFCFSISQVKQSEGAKKLAQRRRPSRSWRRSHTQTCDAALANKKSVIKSNCLNCL